MEGILRHRQLRLWDEICRRYPIPPAKAKKVREWILSGTFQEHAQNYSNVAATKRQTKSDRDSTNSS